MNSNTLNLNILGKDNIGCVSLVNATMCSNSTREPNVLDLRNCTLVLLLLDIVQFDYLTINYVNLIPKFLKLVNFIIGRDIQNTH